MLIHELRAHSKIDIVADDNSCSYLSPRLVGHPDAILEAEKNT